MTKYRLANLDCADCAGKIENGVRRLDCVRSASVNFAAQTLKIDATDMDMVRKTIASIDPLVKISAIDSSESDTGEKFSPQKESVFIIVLSALYLSGLFFQDYLNKTSHSWGAYAVFLAIYFLAGWRVLFSAAKNIFYGRVFNENFLMSIATIGAVIINALPEAAGVMLFYRAGEFLQDLSVHKSRRTIKSLLDIRADSADVKRDGEIERVRPEEVLPGETIIVRPGDRVPLDGRILSGDSMVDTSALTGESVPRNFSANDQILAGMINMNALLTVEVTRPFSESSAARILDLVENATERKAKTELFFTKFARYYTPAVVAVSVLTAIIPPLFFHGEAFSSWSYRALVILVISCPCALVVSIPLAYFGGIGGASRKGILIKGSNFLEALNSVTTVVFDKTGTVTKGTFKVREIVPKNGFTENELLMMTAHAESMSNHPISRSIREALGSEMVSAVVTEYREIAGHGIVAEIGGRTIVAGNDRMLHRFEIEHDTCHIPGTVVHTAIDGKYAGYITIGDEVKKEAPDAVRELKKIGVTKTVILTGDNYDIARDVAGKLDVDEFQSELLPEGKVHAMEKITEEKTSGKCVFVGDGINDAPVLARADIGVAMGSIGTDAAIETADVIIMNDSLLKLPEAITIAKKTRAILIENIAFALAVKGFLIVMGFMGIATMWEAVFADVGVTVIAVINSTRAMR